MSTGTNCGDGAGGFEAGNTCAAGGGSSLERAQGRRGSMLRKSQAGDARRAKVEALQRTVKARPAGEIGKAARDRKAAGVDPPLASRARESAERAVANWRDRAAAAGKPVGDAWKSDRSSVGSHGEPPGPDADGMAYHHAAFEAIHAVHGDGPLPKVAMRAKPEYPGGAQGIYGQTKEGTPAVAIASEGLFPAFSAVHEYGHFLDNYGLGIGGNHYASERGGPAAPLMDALEATPEVRGLRKEWEKADPRVRKYLGYLLEPSELFARAYSQYIAHRSGHPGLNAALGDAATTPVGKLAQWSPGNFGPIAEHFDTIFRRNGWLHE